MQLDLAPPKRHILAVDDCPVQRELLTAQLQAAGYSVESVASGEAALDAARSHHFDAVILDVNMPGLDGAHVGRACVPILARARALIVMHTTEAESTVKARFDAFDGYVAQVVERGPRRGAPEQAAVIGRTPAVRDRRKDIRPVVRLQMLTVSGGLSQAPADILERALTALYVDSPQRWQTFMDDARVLIDAMSENLSGFAETVAPADPESDGA